LVLFNVPIHSKGLKRVIGGWELTALAINGIVGAGIFGLPARAYALTGVWSLLAFLACAGLAICVAFCFAEVGSRYRETGGPYLYGREGLGPSAGFVVGWLWWLSRAAAFAANLNLMIDYGAFLLPSLHRPVFHQTAIIVIALTLLTINLSGVRQTTNASTVFTIAKLTVLLLFVTVGLFYLDATRFQASTFAFSGDRFATAILLLIYAFTGFEMVSVPAGEWRNPQKDLPRSLLAAVGMVAILYIALQVVCIGTLPDLALSTRPLADAAQQFSGGTGAAFVVAGAIVSILGNLNLLLMSSSRIPFAMACQGDLPRWLGKVHPRWRTPYGALIATAFVMLCLSLSRSFLTALTISSASRLVAYGATAVALLRLRKKVGAPAASLRMPFAPVIVPFTLVLIIWLLVHTSAAEAIQTALLTFLGFVVFAWTSARRRRSSAGQWQ